MFLPREHIRDIFTLSGIVRPAVLTDGTVTGWWSYKNRNLTITDFGSTNLEFVEETACVHFPDVNQIIVK